MSAKALKRQRVISVRYLVVGISLLILLFQDSLSKRFSISFIGYFDELLAVVGIVYLVIFSFRHRFSPHLQKMFLCLILVLGIGAISTYASDVGVGTYPALLDAFSFMKIYVIFAAVVAYLTGFKEHESLIKLISSILFLFVAIGLVLGIVNLFMPIGMHTDIRYGIRTFNYVFSRVGGLYEFGELAFVLFFLDAYLNKRTFVPLVGIIATALMLIMTMRARAFVFVAVFFFLYVFQSKIGKGKLNAATFVVLAGIVAFIGFDQFYTYFLDDETTARKTLLEYGMLTCTNYFPLGSGFGTYGTNVAKLYNSPLYAEYGFNLIYGLGYVKSNYATDNSWPAVFAELGIFGGLAFVGVVYNCLADGWKKSKRARGTRFLASYLIICFLIETTATASVFSSATLMFVLAIVASLGERLSPGSKLEQTKRKGRKPIGRR